jgi:hypothetical protein
MTTSSLPISIQSWYHKHHVKSKKAKGKGKAKVELWITEKGRKGLQMRGRH